MTDIFVSYQSSDRERAGRLAHALGREFPHLSLFWDRTIRAGLKFDEVSHQALNQAACVPKSPHPTAVKFEFEFELS